MEYFVVIYRFLTRIDDYLFIFLFRDEAARPSDIARISGHMDLAQWLAQKEQPLSPLT